MSDKLSSVGEEAVMMSVILLSYRRASARTLSVWRCGLFQDGSRLFAHRKQRSLFWNIQAQSSWFVYAEAYKLLAYVHVIQVIYVVYGEMCLEWLYFDKVEIYVIIIWFTVLQIIESENFPFAKNLVMVEKEIRPPQYMGSGKILDVSPILKSTTRSSPSSPMYRIEQDRNEDTKVDFSRCLHWVTIIN